MIKYSRSNDIENLKEQNAKLEIELTESKHHEAQSSEHYRREQEDRNKLWSEVNTLQVENKKLKADNDVLYKLVDAGRGNLDWFKEYFKLKKTSMQSFQLLSSALRAFANEEEILDKKSFPEYSCQFAKSSDAIEEVHGKFVQLTFKGKLYRLLILEDY